MRPFNLRNLSVVMAGTQREVQKIITDAINPPVVEHGFITYQGAYSALKRACDDQSRGREYLEQWRDDTTISEANQTFRHNAYPRLVWCLTDVVPHITRVVADLGGDRQAEEKHLFLAETSFSGGFHLQVEWDNSSRRLVYFLGPRWTLLKIQAMLTLLQLKAMDVYHMTPQTVTLVDIYRRRVLQVQNLDPDGRRQATEAAAYLRDEFYRQQAS